MRTLRLLTLALATTIAQPAVAYDTCAQWGFTCNWPGYAPSNFPSRVYSIVYPSGVVMNATRSIRHGKWTVSLGSSVSAFYTSRTDGLGSSYEIAIKGLKCTNAVVGEIPCTLRLFWYGAGAKYCSLDSADLKQYDPGGDVKGMILWSQHDNICPTDLRLVD